MIKWFQNKITFNPGTKEQNSEKLNGNQEKQVIKKKRGRPKKIKSDYELESKEGSDSDSDFNPGSKKKKRKKNNAIKKKVSKTAKGKKNVESWNNSQPMIEMKQEINELDYKYQNYTFDDSDLNLSEQFIALILQQVDDLCENIKSGDPNVPRTLVVNQNLNNAVNCYRISMSNEYFRRKRNKDSIKKENLTGVNICPKNQNLSLDQSKLSPPKNS